MKLFFNTALLFFISTLFVTTTFSQTSIGLRAGMNLANVNYSGEGSDFSTYGGASQLMAGIVIENQLSYNFAIQPEFLYMKKGFKATSNVLSIETTTSFTFIEVPLLVKSGWRNERIKIEGLIGPSFGYMLGGKIKTETEEIDVVYDNINRLEIGLHFGAAFHLYNDFGAAFIDTRYVTGLSNLSKIEGQTVKSKGINLSIGFLYRMSDHGGGY